MLYRSGGRQTVRCCAFGTRTRVAEGALPLQRAVQPISQQVRTAAVLNGPG